MGGNRVTITVDEVADSLFSRIRGLMFRRRKTNLLFVFDRETVHPIHSFFVPYAFDAIYLDSDMRVTEVFQDVKPFGSVWPKTPSKYLLELAKTGGSTARSRRRIKPGRTIRIVFKNTYPYTR